MATEQGQVLSRDKVVSIERSLVSLHATTFPKAARVELPPVGEIEPGPIQAVLEGAAGVPELITATGGGSAPPLAGPAEPVDRYELMREYRRVQRVGIPIWRLRERIAAARAADVAAEAAAAEEEAGRIAEQEAEQSRLDDLWLQLGQARERVNAELPEAISAERQRLDADRDAEQQRLDEEWERLLGNDPASTLGALKRAFANNRSPTSAIVSNDDRVVVAVQFAGPDELVPERKPAHTPTGKPTLKKRTKTEVNALYLEALGSTALATAKAAFAAAPGIQGVQLLVVCDNVDKKHANQLVPIYAGAFARSEHEGANTGRDPALALTLADEAVLNLKGQTKAVAPIDLGDRPDLEAAMEKLGAR